jgi:hypothetical protein
MTAKSQLQNHPNSPDTSSGWFWMAWEEFLLHPCLAQQAGLGGAVC